MRNRLSFWSALAGLSSVASACTQTPPVVSQVDPNTPVISPRLIATILKHQKAPSNETAVEVVSELKKSDFLVAIFLNRSPEQTSETQALFRKGDSIKFAKVLDSNDNTLLPLFTDHSELHRFTNEINSTLVMSGTIAMNFVLKNGYAGLVVNPANETALKLDTPFIRKVTGEM